MAGTLATRPQTDITGPLSALRQTVGSGLRGARLCTNAMVYEAIIDGKSYRLELERVGSSWQCQLDGQKVEVDAVLARRDVISMLIGGRAFEIKRERTATDLHLWVGSTRYAAELRDPRSLRSRGGAARDQKGPKKLTAPMPGRVVRTVRAPRRRPA